MDGNEDVLKSSAVLSSLKGRLADGAWRPGDRLPTRLELVADLQSSPVTIQRAIDQLVREGFVETRGRQGTFAAETPPFLRNVAVAITGRSDDRARWIHYWRVLELEAGKVIRESGREPQFYYGLEDPIGPEGSRLADDVAGRRLFGVLFANVPGLPADAPILNQSHTPLFAVGRRSARSEKVSRVVFADEQFFDLACAALAKSGRRRVGLLTPFVDPRHALPAFMAAAKTHGLVAYARWCHFVPQSPPGILWAVNAIQSMMADRERPDAVVIHDDNLVEPAMQGLQAAGCAVPSDCRVVAHTNFPWPVPSPHPLIRIGVDLRGVISTTLEAMARRRDGSQPEDLAIPLQVVDEIDGV